MRTDRKRERDRKRYAANPKKVYESNLKWKIANPEKVKEMARKWRANNLEKSRGYSRKWRSANREKQRQAARNWKLANPEKVRAMAREAARLWRQKNKSKHVAQNAARSALKKKLSPGLTTAEQNQVLALYKKAAQLTLKTGVVHHVDHDKPLVHGGLHHPNNLKVIPAWFNCSKGGRYRSTADFIKGVKA